MSAFTAWFTAARRKAIYVALGTLTVLLVAAGLIDNETSDKILDITQKTLAVLTSLLAVINLSPDSINHETADTWEEEFDAHDVADDSDVQDH